MQDGERRARIVTAVTERGAAASIGELMSRLCRFAVDELALSGCALVLMSSREGGRVLADAGPRARTITTLQAELGEGPCLQAYMSGVPVLLPDLASEEANRWPAFAAAALAAGLHSEFSLPLGTVRNGIGTLDLCRDTAGMLSEDQLSDALAAADIARDAVLTGQYAPGGLEDLLAAAGIDRLVVHQATGMVAAQLDESVGNALARLRAAAFTSGRSMYDLAQAVVERRVRFDE
jgi:GAF domain-containing protein